MNTNIQGTRYRSDASRAMWAPVDVATCGNTPGSPFLPDHVWDPNAETYVGSQVDLLVGCTDAFDEEAQEECRVREGDRVLVRDNPDARQNGIFFRSSADNEPWRLRRAFDANSASDLLSGRCVVVLRGLNGAGETFTHRALGAPRYTTALGNEVTPAGSFQRNGGPGVSYLYFD